MPKERLQKKVIEQELNKNDYDEYIVVLKREFKKNGAAMIVRFYPTILGKITIDKYVRYINLETKLENKYDNKIETFKTLEAAQNFIKKNQEIFDVVLNEKSKVKLETLRKIVNLKWEMLKKSDKEDE